jgi:hypothetical protein
VVAHYISTTIAIQTADSQPPPSSDAEHIHYHSLLVFRSARYPPVPTLDFCLKDDYAYPTLGLYPSSCRDALNGPTNLSQAGGILDNEVIPS